MMRVLLIDNYDSFTYNLYDYFQQLGVHCQVIRNDAIAPAVLDQLNFDALVISPGPRRPENAGISMSALAYAIPHIPVLGICLGHQAIGQYFGHALVHAAEPMHGKTSLIHCQPHPVFDGIPPEMTVMRYHSLIIEPLANSPLEIIAQTESGEIMAVAHPFKPLVGLQFHPESILTPHGLQLLSNWLTLSDAYLANTLIPFGQTILP